MRFLKFNLSAPLQSWGEDSRWDNRNTAAMPTKSGIIGLLGCCFGYPRGDERLNHLDQSLSMAVRANSPGQIMTDFHTVHGTGDVLLTASGETRRDSNDKNSSTIISRRQYLQNAHFSVFLWASGREDSDAVLEECFHAMRHPRWAVYLGRKSCPPSRPLLPEWVEAGTPDDVVSLFADEERTICDNCDNHAVSVEMELMPGDILSPRQRVITRHDVLLRADLNQYSPRQVRAYTIHSGG